MSFQNLGGSWKREGMRTKSKRLLHGKFGKGRFRAFSLGNKVTWRSTYDDNGTVRRFEICGEAARLGEFIIWNPHEAENGTPGMWRDEGSRPGR